jgi:hypothetical protein
MNKLIAVLSLAAGCALSGCANQQTAPGEASRVGLGPPSADSQPTPADPAPNSTSTQLTQLIQAGKVTELRTSYNDSYGASLLFQPEDMMFYVTLFQDEKFWRVYSTLSDKQAQQAFDAFAAQSRELAAAELRKVILQAQDARLRQQLDERNAQLNRLRADQALRERQEAEFARQQQRAAGQVQALAEGQREAQSQLQALHAQIEALQARQAELTPLPAPAGAPTNKKRGR